MEVRNAINLSMDWKKKTLQTYNDSAEALANYFKGIGPRIIDINLALELANVKKDAKVVEVGCGDGRDAKEIIKRSAWYQGFDPSEGLLKLAKKTNPTGSFVQADALSYNYPKNVDVVFAFASLLHINKDDMSKALAMAAKSIKEGGIYFISLKERPEYTEEAKTDKFGERMFYFYNVNIIKELSVDWFKPVYESNQRIGKTDWFTVALKRKTYSI